MSELKVYGFCNIGDFLYRGTDRGQSSNEMLPYYLKSEVDAVLAEKDKEIAELKQKLESVQASMYCDVVNAGMENRRLQHAVWLMRAERYKTREFIAREEACLCMQITWKRFLRERPYNQWVDQLLRIARLANKLHNKCLAKVEEYR